MKIIKLLFSLRKQVVLLFSAFKVGGARRSWYPLIVSSICISSPLVGTESVSGWFNFTHPATPGQKGPIRREGGEVVLKAKSEFHELVQCAWVLSLNYPLLLKLAKEKIELFS